MTYTPLHFISEAVQVEFDEAPVLEKKPPCPKGFIWDETRYVIVAVLSEWQDYERRGKMAVNMRDSHLATARRRGSWGVGRHYFRVRVDTGQIFELYYDRAPKSVDERKGEWVLFQELKALA